MNLAHAHLWVPSKKNVIVFKRCF